MLPRRVMIKGVAAFSFGVSLLVCGCARESIEGTAQDHLGAGWDAYRLGEFKSAVLSFELGQSRVQDGDPLSVDFLYALATVWNLRLPVSDQDKPLATGLYRRIADEFAGHALAPWAGLALARMQHLVPVGEEPDFDAVRQAYLDGVMNPFAGSIAAEEATIYYYSTYVAAMDVASARQALEGLETFIAQNPDTAFRSGAHALAAMACEQLKKGDAQLVHELAALDTMERDPRNPFYDYAARYWKLATTAEFQAGDFATARTYYNRLLTEYPQDVRSFAATLSLKRMRDTEDRLRAETGGQN